MFCYLCVNFSRYNIFDYRKISLIKILYKNTQLKWFTNEKNELFSCKNGWNVKLKTMLSFRVDKYTPDENQSNCGGIKWIVEKGHKKGFIE